MSGAIALTREGEIAVADLGDGENRVGPDFAAGMHAVLDTAQSESEEIRAIVITGSGKFFSNGLDLETLLSADAYTREMFGRDFGRLIGRMVISPVPLVAAINGHAFAAGLAFALACDYRVMRADRGWVCMPEVDISVPVAPPMIALLAAKLSPQTLRDALLTGRRYAAEEALAAGFVDGIASEAELRSQAISRAEALGAKPRPMFESLKRGLYGGIAGGFGVEPS